MSTRRGKYASTMAYKKYSTIVPVGVRMQPELKEKLEAEARSHMKSGRPSLNAEIVERLERSFESQTGLGKYSDGELIDELIRRWGRDALYIRLGKEDPT